MPVFFTAGFIICAVLYLSSLHVFRANVRKSDTRQGAAASDTLRGLAAIRMAWARRYPLSEGLPIYVAVAGLRVLPPLVVLCLAIEAARVIF